MGITLDEILLDNNSAIKIQDTAGHELDVNADGSINATVTATDLDIRDLAFATDKVDVSGSSVTATATDFDIRDLSATQDNVAISDGTDTMAVNADGSINVSFSVPTADDAVDAGNPLKIGYQAYSTLSTVAAGDRANAASDLHRRLRTNPSADIGMNTEAASVGTTAGEVLASPLAGRRLITFQNRGTDSVFLLESAATAKTQGIEIPKKSSATYEIGENINVYLVADSGTQDVRLLELA